MYGNVSKLRDASACPQKSFLFFLTSRHLGNGLTGDGVQCWVEQVTFGLLGALAMVHENLRESLKHTLGRTNNRIRSPRLAASGQLEEGR